MPNKPITKAVLACGGWSTRFLPTVKTYAKQLLPILDKPQILWVMEELVNAGITDFCIVHRDGEESLKRFFQPDSNLDSYLASTGKTKAMDSFNSVMSKVKNLQFLPQTSAFPYGTGSPVLVAESFIDADPFVYLYADDLVIEPQPGERKSIPLGLAIEIPKGFVGLMWDKSGLSHKHGIKTFGGVIDAGFRGEWHVGVINLSSEAYTFEKGHKIVQVLIQAVERPTIQIVDELSKTERGEKWVGSSGK